jgi:hypothetical protein
MTSTITTAVTVFFVVFGVYAANLVVYHPQNSGLNPTSPVTQIVDWK